MGRIGPMEVVLIVLAIVVLFGIKKLPEIGSALGKALREFKKALQGVQSTEDDIKKNAEDKNAGSRS